MYRAKPNYYVELIVMRSLDAEFDKDSLEDFPCEKMKMIPFGGQTVRYSGQTEFASSSRRGDGLGVDVSTIGNLTILREDFEQEKKKLLQKSSVENCLGMAMEN
ncbi:hypothetical protein GE061_018089 [Apolygus lucorum]|uniref:Uncharacterized protein n=1 Tax=Apolygus lucorum TaxID=248454 RepID=A0A8S9XD06_APOLU|nr:hypothetical protein GE061_018089 [Apolygus lucorum]